MMLVYISNAVTLSKITNIKLKIFKTLLLVIVIIYLPYFFFVSAYPIVYPAAKAPPIPAATFRTTARHPLLLAPRQQQLQEVLSDPKF
ncbi:hypothetical protein EFM34_05525 [Leuconostoc suionicum]|nr:hypothetical protein [Leuconostoc suionicum]